MILMLGPLGSGKGTQIEKILKIKHFEVFQLGEKIRKIVKEKLNNYKYYENVLKTGSLVEEKYLLELLCEINSNNCILDGFPRSVEQLNVLKVFAVSKGFKLDLIINFQLDDENIKKRIYARNENRIDDVEEIIEKRIVSYKKNHIPLLEEIAKNYKIHTINANLNEEVVFDQIKLLLVL